MRVIVDTGFWYSLLGTREREKHALAERIYEDLVSKGVKFIVPFPTLYETLNTKLLKEKYQNKSEWFLKQLSANPLFEAVPDEKYREEAYTLTTVNNSRGISLVDNIIRVMIQKNTPKLDMLLTFNLGDFVDVCAKSNVGYNDQV